MTSIYRKTAFYNSIRLSRLYLSKYMCSVQHLCSAANCKSDVARDRKDNNFECETDFNHIRNNVKSDTFGTLRTSLEQNHRFNHKRSHQMDLGNKKIIKIKKPQSDEFNTFGTLSGSKPIWYPDFHEAPKEDNDLSDDSVIVKNISKKIRKPEIIFEQMKDLVNQKKIKDALDLFVEMRRNYVTPLYSQYTYMIGVCGKVGYTEMAFKLLRQMTDRGLNPSPAVLTGLFNSCAESPFPEYGLKKAHLLKEKIEMKNWGMTQITYHAMVKGFGKCGDLQTAFKIVDEMAKADIKISGETFNFLLMSCIAKKDVGFTYAIEVWRMLTNKKCQPNSYTFNLLLRATRDCEVGPDDISSLLLQHWSSYSNRPYGFLTKEKLKLKEKPILKLKSGSGECSTESLDKDNENHFTEDNVKKQSEPLDDNSSKYEVENINTKIATAKSDVPFAGVLSPRPTNGTEILEILNVKTPSERLNLMGGLDGFLSLMFKSKVQPNIKTFTLLLDCMPDTVAEENLLSVLDSYQIKPDINFFNVLIKNRNFRKETEAAHNVLIFINKYELIPDIMTFGALALGCRTLKMATTFVSEMKKMNVHPNIEIVGCMIRQASMMLDFSYMKYVLELMEKEQIKPNERILSTLEKILSKARKSIILMEHGKEVNRFYQREGLSNDFKVFFNFYEQWLKKMKFQSEEHPWSQYKTDIIDREKIENVNAH